MFDGAVVGNIASNFGYTIKVGLSARLREIDRLLENDKNNIELLAMKQSVEAVFLLAEKYRKKAVVHNAEMAEALKKIPYEGASSYYEALLFLKILIYSLWLNGNKHITIGRFDQYLFGYYSDDIRKNIINREEAKDLTEEFFISLNFDADLYPGIQQGDNGQSLVVGGCDENGREVFNELSKLVLEASLELNLIDPKINMRVNRNTSEDWFLLGTELTKKGLGFPQYSNDEIVIPALVKWGYDLADARNYVVAACWEFIIPGKAMDIPNIDACNFPRIVDEALKDHLMTSETYSEFENIIYEYLEKEVGRLVKGTNPVFILPSPLQSVLMDDCVENKKDISEGGKYNNFGFHGVGVSNAVDAMAAVKHAVFSHNLVGKAELLEALDRNFAGYEKLRHILLSVPKMGSNDPFVDDIAVTLLDKFADECAKHKNSRGGIYRPGTGSAMYYIWYSENQRATADGRLKGENYPANYSPSLETNFKGVLSVIHSFSKPHLERVCNGGPLTLEFHDTLFKNGDGVSKVAKLVRTFVILGGHQLQLNALNREVLLDAQKHPEKYKNLIVRVWGWSGYFNELDLVYQNHIIKRTEFLG